MALCFGVYGLTGIFVRSEKDPGNRQRERPDEAKTEGTTNRRTEPERSSLTDSPRLNIVSKLDTSKELLKFDLNAGRMLFCSNLLKSMC